MKKKLLALALTLALLLPLVPAANVYAEGEKPEFYGSSLSLENNIAINFVVDAYAFKQAGFTLPQVTFAFRGDTTTVTAYTMKNGYYYFTYRDIYAMYMGDTVTATLSGMKDGARVYGDPIEQSVVSYCSDLLDLYGDNATLRTLVVDLLTYGAKSQQYFGYNTGSLATASLTPAQLAWGTSSDPDPVSIKNAAYATATDPEVTWYGSNLILVDSVDLQFFFNADDTNMLRIDVKNGSGDVLATFYEEDIETVGDYRRVRLNTLTPDQMGEALFVTAYRNLGDFGVGSGELPVAGLTESPVSDTLRYSIESYAAEAIDQKHIPALTALLNAMLNYGASTAAYAAAPGSGTVVTTPTLRSTLEALPVASSSMTNNELRDLVVSFFETSSSIPWVVREDTPYTYKGEEIDEETEEDFTICADTIYCGMPYSNAGSSIYQFLDYYDEETGVLKHPYGSAIGSTLGNHCCSAVYWAWSRVSSTIKFQSTDYMTYENGVLPVGNYEIDQSVAHFTADYNTKTVCTNNGEDAMFEAYAQLKPGDALVAFNKVGDTLVTHHAMLAVSVTKRTSAYSGKILGDYSYVTIDDQSNLTEVATIGGQSAERFGRLNKEFTFSFLYEKGYIPVTCKELAGAAAVADATAALSSNPTGTFTLNKLVGKSVKTNYSLAKVTISALDARGNVVASVYAHTKYRNKNFSLSTIAPQLDDQLAAGTYTIRIDALLANGQTKTVYVHTLTKA